ncbi:MAG: hypothetical protein ACOC1F_02620 [Myxococcota bacterium]
MLAALAVALLCVRPALAYAPFCDPRAASNHAPPPFTKIPDLRWEPSTALWEHWCERLQAARSLDRDPEPQQNRFSKSAHQAWPDTAASRATVSIPRRPGAIRSLERIVRGSGPRGVRVRVYRPPR